MTLCKLFLILFLALLAGCSTIGSVGATVNDTMLTDAQFMICSGVSVGSWMRAYGNDLVKVQAWRDLCGTTVQQAPVAAPATLKIERIR
jgi:hypothetical protein